jgi:hypothetical protein
MKPINENDYKPDLEICDRYISFSSELLRLSLLAITGLGALIFLNFENKRSSIAQNQGFTLNDDDKGFVLITLILFAFSAAGCLAHRFYASDSMSYHIAFLREEDPKKQQDEKDGRKRCLKRAEVLLIITECLFGTAVIALVATLIVLLRLN